MHLQGSTEIPTEHEQPCLPKAGQILLNRANLKSLGITFSNAQLLRLEGANRFPRRLRLSGASVCWDHGEVMAWIDARKAERAGWHYADAS
jgi:predicted DNA-binding transcriptional regulator AlpA